MDLVDWFTIVSFGLVGVILLVDGVILLRDWKDQRKEKEDYGRN